MSDNNREAIVLYFNKDSPIDMDVYHFLRSSPRKKSKFVIKLINYFLREEKISDIANLSDKMCCRIIDNAIDNAFDFKLNPSTALSEKTVQNISETELQYIVQKILSSLPKEFAASNVQSENNGNDVKEHLEVDFEKETTQKPKRTNYFKKDNITKEEKEIFNDVTIAHSANNSSSMKPVLEKSNSFEINLPDDDDIGLDWQLGMQMFNSL